MVLPHSLRTDVHQILKHMARLVEQAEREPLSDDQWRSAMRRLRRTQEGITNDLSSLDPSVGMGKPVPFLTAEAIGEVVDVMAPLAVEKRLHFDWIIDGGLPGESMGDKRLLQELLQGVLDHYVRHADGGRVHLSAGSTISGGSAQLRLTVSGSLLAGPLQAEELPSGLWLLQERLAEAGGTLLVTENADATATVCFTLPVQVVGPVATNLGLRGTDGPGKETAGKAILVAEDSDESFQLIELYTACESHVLTRAWNGVEAVALAKTGSFDLIVMDIGMPVMDGHQATRWIREWETEQGRPRIPVLLFSAATDEKQVRLGATVGCSGYLAKPATQKQLLAALRFYARPAEQPLDGLQ
jgi:CheY-like chemotaxis protein